jgi:Hemerythrin HHE cation binding domain
MTITLHPIDIPAMPVLDLYLDIHKGIRAELFAVTLEAGRVDADDMSGAIEVAGHVSSVGALLESHAAHEDVHVDPVLAEVDAALAESIRHDHHALEARWAFIDELARQVTNTDVPVRRAAGHHLYLELTGFTSAYLTHQLVEERVVMPALEAAIGVPAVLEIHSAIVGSIPPEEMMRSLALMLPAMTSDDRAGLLGGMREGAPPEVFEAVWGLARTVLDPWALAATARRLGIPA